MAKYLVRASYSTDGVRGLLSEGGTSRRDAVKAAIESAGGTLDTFLYSFGEGDLYVIADMPDQESMAALALNVAAAGALRPQTTVLLTPEQVDEAVKKDISYRAPGA